MAPEVRIEFSHVDIYPYREQNSVKSPAKMSGYVSVSSCLSVKAVCQGKSICLDIYICVPHPPSGSKSLAICVGTSLFSFSCITRFRWSLFEEHVVCISTELFCRSHTEMYQNAEKYKNRGNTLISTQFSRVCGTTGIFLSAPGVWLSSVKIRRRGTLYPWNGCYYVGTR